MVVTLIKEIGILMAFLDKDLSYLGRSFCILELYAAVSGDVALLVKTNAWTSSAVFERYGPIDVSKATARNPDDKKLIDEFISSLPGGHARLNEAVTDAIRNSAICD